MAKVKLIRHYKIVRDCIPEVLKSAGIHCECDVVTNTDELRELMLLKIEEEIREYRGKGKCGPCFDELPDIFEAVLGLGAIDGYTEDHISAQAKDKREQRGGFTKGIFLRTTVEDL